MITLKSVLSLLLVFMLFSNNSFAGGSQGRPLEISITQRAVLPEHRTLKVQRGAELQIVWRADEELELHLHGYDLTFTLQPGKEAEMTLKAERAGRYPLTIHAHHQKKSKEGKSLDLGGGHKALLYIEVHP